MITSVPWRRQVAEEYNDRAVQAFRDKHWQLCYDVASEAIRLNPTKVAYLGNRAAAGIKLGQKRHLRQAAIVSIFLIIIIIIARAMRRQGGHSEHNHNSPRHASSRRP